MKGLKDLAPHEKEILKSELLREELIQQRLADAVLYSWRKNNEKIFDNLGGLEGIKSICKQLEEHGLTPEQAKEMSPEEFGKFLEEHDIKVE